MWDEIHAYIRQKINQRKEANALRELHINPDLIDFCSNDYLGLARSKDIQQCVERDLSKHSTAVNGSTGARTITGTSSLTLELETFLANFHHAPSALLYNSGYTANLGLFSALPYRGDTIIYDELIHASIRDGIQLSRSNSYSFRHNDVDHLYQRLQAASGKKYVAVESVYSMDGDMSPLREIVDICKKFDAALIVDEAHSNGLFGENGNGMVCQQELEQDVFARIMTFGKALGCHGAAVLGSKDLSLFLTNYSRPFIFTTAPSPHQLLTIKYAYDKMSEMNDIRLKISNLIHFFKKKIEEYSIPGIESNSPIQCIVIPGNTVVKQVAKQTQQAGFDVRPIVAPTVPQGKERIRICLHAFNTEKEVEELILVLANAYERVMHVEI